jgi:ornithine carbamoyltransferase
MKKDLTKITDLNAEDIKQLIESAFEYKAKFDKGIRSEDVLEGKSVAMIFEKPSLRTKVAFELAAKYLGGTSVFLSSGQIFASGNNEKGRESIPDIARNLERFCDLIFARVYSHDTIQILAQSVSKPVINALCDLHHPTQALADLMTIQWHKEKFDGLKVAFIGDGNNVAVSLMQACELMGIEFAIATPKGYEIPLEFANGHFQATNDPVEAVMDADVVYADTFVSMGQEEDKLERLKEFEGFQVNSKLLSHAKPDAIFMHCLPAHRGEEVTDEVMDSSQSVIFDQAECRMHIAKALLSFYL